MFWMIRGTLVLVSLSIASFVTEPPDDGSVPAEEITPSDTASETTPAPASQPASRPVAAPRNPLQAEIYRELLREIDRPEVFERNPSLATNSPPRTSDTPLVPEGTTWMQRAGRLIRTGSKSVFQFKGGPPVPGAAEEMEFNRNGWLESMEREAERGVESFIVSVEVTQYRGKNYLNLLKYRRQLSHGNLAP